MFIRIGDSLSRSELDDPSTNHCITFWKDVSEAFSNGDDLQYSGLISSHDAFLGILCEGLPKHAPSKLETMWKSIRREYKRSSARYTQSGTHSSDFFNFCNFKIEVMYLHEHLQLRPNLTNYVKGGFKVEDTFDSTKTIPEPCTPLRMPQKVKRSPGSEMKPFIEILKSFQHDRIERDEDKREEKRQDREEKRQRLYLDESRRRNEQNTMPSQASQLTENLTAITKMNEMIQMNFTTLKTCDDHDMKIFLKENIAVLMAKCKEMQTSL